MPRRQLAAALLGLVTAAACIRLGIWQLDRLQQRRLQNALLVTRMSAPPASPFGLIAGTRQWRRVTVAGTFDFDHQLVYAGRSREGAPGVYILTPLTPDVPPGFGVAPLLVNRGWVYSPDARTIDLAKYDEAPHQRITGYVDEFDYHGTGPARAAADSSVWLRLDAREIHDAFQGRIAPFFVVAQADSGAAPAAGAPVRLPLPTVDEGPHRGYAFQWFAFAAIALVGAGAVIWRDRKGARPAGA
ncbi:MAG TPA: SURF1 family protein [Gemmatimonadaceae bacterium]|nr:SURF1 family protein [Gemmatimonadaceae bacterium]